MSRFKATLLNFGIILARALQLVPQVKPEQVARAIIKRGDPGSGTLRGRPNVNKSLTWKRPEFKPGSYDYEAALDIVNRRRRRAGLTRVWNFNRISGFDEWYAAEQQNFPGRDPRPTVFALNYEVPSGLSP